MLFNLKIIVGGSGFYSSNAVIKYYKNIVSCKLYDNASKEIAAVNVLILVCKEKYFWNFIYTLGTWGKNWQFPCIFIFIRFILNLSTFLYRTHTE